MTRAASAITLVLITFSVAAWRSVDHLENAEDAVGLEVSANGELSTDSISLTTRASNLSGNGAADFEAAFEFPILVLADGNRTATTSTTLSLATTNVDQLFLYLNNVAYAAKGRVWLDNGTPKTPIVFQEGSVAVCAYREALQGCFANNSNRNHRALFNLPSDWKSGSNPLRVGSNTLVFEMTVPTGKDPVWIDHGHGYRVRWLDFVKKSEVNQNGKGLISWWRSFGKQLRFDNVDSPVEFVDYGSQEWKADGLGSKLGNAAAISRGAALYKDRSLSGTRAACADCHATHGGDIELWQLETRTIIEVGRARGKSLAEAQDIAAYVRSFEWEVDGQVRSERAFPWCSPYQPGNSMITGRKLSETPVYLWAFGSCEVPDYDSDTEAAFIDVLGDFEPGDVTKPFNYEDLPMAVEEPSWHSWLPTKHLLDMIPTSESSWGPPLAECLGAARSLDAAATILSCLRYTQHMKQNGFFNAGQQSGASTEQMKSIDNANGIRSMFMHLLEAMMMSGTDYQDQHSAIYDTDNHGVEPGCRSWTRMTRTLFEPVGHLSGTGPAHESWMFSPVGDSRGERWGNHAWYNLAQIVTNSCDDGFNGTNPVDFGYQQEFFQEENGMYRVLADHIEIMADMNKFNTSGGLSGVHNGLSAPGWTPKMAQMDHGFRRLYVRGGIDHVSTQGMAAFYNAYFKFQKAIFDAYTQEDPTFDKTCAPVPGSNPPHTDVGQRSGGYPNAPCVDRGGQDGHTYRYQWPNVDYNLNINPASIGAQLNGPDHIQNHYRLLYQANATPGVDKSVLLAVAAHYDNLLNSGTKWQSVVTGNTDPQPDPEPDPTSQSLNLLQGWNMVSSYIAPDASDMSAVFSSITDDVILVKDIAGNQYHPESGLNTIGDWSSMEAYQIYAGNETTLDLRGSAVDPSSQIHLVAGWNQIPFLNDEELPVSSALQSIASDVTLVKDYAGRVYYPAFGIDEIGLLRPGQGYKVHTSTNATLVYPNVAGISAKSGGFFDAIGVASSATLIVSAPDYADGMRISAVTDDGRIVGNAVVSHGKAVLTVMGDDQVTQSFVEGAHDGDRLSLVGTFPGGYEEIALDALRIKRAVEDSRPQQSILYDEDAVFVVDLEDPPQDLILDQNYPNPFATTTSIGYTISRPGRIRLELFNMVGERVAVVVDEIQEGGSYLTEVDGSHLASGVYIYRLISDDTVEYKQMMLVK